MNPTTSDKNIHLVPMEGVRIGQACALFNQCAGGRELPHKPLSEEQFERLFLHPAKEVDALAVCALEGDTLLGFAGGNRKNGSTAAYLTFAAVTPPFRRKGIATLLVHEVEDRLIRASAEAGFPLECIDARFLNPSAFEWVVPGTDGHDHPNAPGIDVSTDGYLFMKNIGYRDLDTANSFHRTLSGFRHGEHVETALTRLADEGLRITFYDKDRHKGMEDLLDDLGSEVWRETLLSNAAKPEGGLPVLILEDGNRMCGFAGPMAVQPSGRGYFNGIGIHSAYRRRGAGKALFSSLCKELGDMGATFMTLFTGETNPARNIYESAGFKIVRVWACMRKTLDAGTSGTKS